MTSAPVGPPALPLARIPRASLNEEVHRRLCDLILDGQIAPGQTMTLQGLADGFGVSIMPVREALRRLAAAKALTLVFGRSIGVPPLAAALLLDLTRVRLEMEGLAAFWAAGRMTPDAITTLHDAMTAMDRAVRDGDTKTYLRANRAFHFAIYAAAESDVLVGLIEQLWLRISPFFNLLRSSDNYTQANRHHHAIVAAAMAGDAAAARDGIKADIAAATAMLLRLLPSTGQAATPPTTPSRHKAG